VSKNRQAAIAAVQQHRGAGAYKAMTDLLSIYISEGKDRLVTATPEEFQAIQGGTKALQMVLKAIISQPPTES